ncbi:mirror-image polydactyly gene 1 protein isoform X1 [Syngnathus scovelli]|uniref:mirror-image polydactyly gene 1 protein isoform X1 n=1 Tax=Syngnathus scovelli TaxID=161590 RepID=UPI0021104317|nr:mirror-image polydactyly gene 1 protein isoform X2 [Syngnathus scovelli]
MRTWMLPLLLKTTALLRCAAWCLFGTLVSRSEANGMLTRAETLTTHERAGIIANDVSSSLTRAVTFPSGHRDAAIGHRAAYGEAPPPDADRKMSLLLRELDALRDANKKLLERLSLKEEELQSKEAELMANTKQAKDWEGPSEFLEQLLSARKDRDEAMMSQVLLANQERDQALRHVARLQQAAKSDASDGPALGDSDLEAEELLGHVCQAVSAQEVAHLGRALVEHVRLATQRRRHMAAQEMEAVMEQRDGSLAKCRRLQQEVLREREQRPSKEELIKLQRERDAALDDRGRLEAELMQANHRFEQLAKAPPPDDDDGHSRAPPLLAQLQQLTEDKHSVEAELLLSQEAERDARERVQRLERLVEVLRKKVGTGSLRPVV